MQKLFIFAALALLVSGCTTLKSTARQPTEGPRARIRLASFADELEVEVREPGGSKGTLYTRSGFYPGKVADLGMPVGPAGRSGYNEYYVVADQDPIVTLHVTHVVSNSPTMQWQSYCAAKGTFHVDAGKDYELDAVILPGAKKGEISMCAIRATEIARDANGSVMFHPIRVTRVAGAYKDSSWFIPFKKSKEGSDS